MAGSIIKKNKFAVFIIIAAIIALAVFSYECYLDSALHMRQKYEKKYGIALPRKIKIELALNAVNLNGEGARFTTFRLKAPPPEGFTKNFRNFASYHDSEFEREAMQVINYFGDKIDAQYNPKNWQGDYYVSSYGKGRAALYLVYCPKRSLLIACENMFH